MLQINTFDKSQVGQLKGSYNAENYLIKNPPSGIKTDFEQVLNRTLDNDHQETQVQVGSLKQIFFDLDENPQVKKGKTMEGLIEQGKEAIVAEAPVALKDADLVMAGQGVEYYQMDYRSIDALAKSLGYEAAAEIKETNRRG
jgi:ferritin-like metal-binding protein YciE